MSQTQVLVVDKENNKLVDIETGEILITKSLDEFESGDFLYIEGDEG